MIPRQVRWEAMEVPERSGTRRTVRVAGAEELRMMRNPVMVVCTEAEAGVSRKTEPMNGETERKAFS